MRMTLTHTSAERKRDGLCLGWVQGQLDFSWQFYAPKQWTCGCLHSDALMLTLPERGFKSTLWWCVTCYIYVWTRAVPFDHGSVGPLTELQRPGGLLQAGRLPCVDIWKTKHSQWNMSPTCVGKAGGFLKGAREREKYGVVKTKEPVQETPHTLLEQGDEFQSCSLPEFLLPLRCSGRSSW